jgi:hypothetical protein
MTRAGACLLAATLMVAPVMVAAQAGVTARLPSEHLTLDASITEALEKNLDLIATRAGVTIAEANLVTARLRFIGRSRRRRRDLPNPADVHADHRRHAGNDAGGTGRGYRVRYPASAGDGDRGRAGIDAPAHTARAAKPLLRGGAAKSARTLRARRMRGRWPHDSHPTTGQGARHDLRCLR